MKQKRPRYSQHFFCNRQLVFRLLRQAGFSRNDVVIEIGPGKGMITEALLQVAGTVIGMEINSDLCMRLQQKFSNNPNFILVNGDFLAYPLPLTPYHIFTNTPFEIEGEIIRKLLDGSKPPESAYLVVIKDVGERWCGKGRESQFSISHKPWFEMAVSCRFRRSDFAPAPKVDSVMIRIKKRQISLLPWAERSRYEQFIRQGFGGGRRLKHNLGPIFGKRELNAVCSNLKISQEAKPSELTVDKWVELYRGYQIR